MKHRKAIPAALLWSSALLLGTADLAVGADVPPRLEGLSIAGRAIADVSEAIDPALPLGSCSKAPKQSRVRLILPNVRNAQGNIRISLYGGDKGDWLAKGRKLLRFDVPARKNRMEICMPLPYGPGDYAIGLCHDEDADGCDVFSEGFGFSNNAKPGLFGPPKFKKVVFRALPKETRLDIRVQY